MLFAQTEWTAPTLLYDSDMMIHTGGDLKISTGFIEQKGRNISFKIKLYNNYKRDVEFKLQFAVSKTKNGLGKIFLGNLSEVKLSDFQGKLKIKAGSVKIIDFSMPTSVFVKSWAFFSKDVKFKKVYSNEFLLLGGAIIAGAIILNNYDSDNTAHNSSTSSGSMYLNQVKKVKLKCTQCYRTREYLLNKIDYYTFLKGLRDKNEYSCSCGNSCIYITDDDFSRARMFWECPFCDVYNELTRHSELDNCKKCNRKVIMD